MTAAELVDEGLRAFGRGDRQAAERAWREALRLDPGELRARACLDQLDRPLGAAFPRRSAVPLPPPPPRDAGGRGAPPPRAAARPVALPPPLAEVTAPVPPGPSGWLRPPVTLPPTPNPLPNDDPFAAPPAPADDPFVAAAAREAEAAASAGAPPPRAPERTTLSDYAPSPWDQGPAANPSVVLAEGEGLDFATVDEGSAVHPLVPQGPPPAGTPPAAVTEVDAWMQSARAAFALGDFSGSLEAIERILKVEPDHAEAREYLAQNEATLIAMYESKLGPPGAVPRLAIAPEEVMWLNLDHRAGFLLAQIDGTVSYEDLFAVSGLPRLDTARILAGLLGQGVIGT